MRIIVLYPSASDKVPGDTLYVSISYCKLHESKFINFAKASGRETSKKF